jgi:hypothetical protein
MKRINFVRDFTSAPGGRFKAHGDHSGEAFRDDILRPALARYGTVVIEMNGVAGFAASFIDEVFRPILDEHGLEWMREHIIVEMDDDAFIVDELGDYGVQVRRPGAGDEDEDIEFN